MILIGLTFPFINYADMNKMTIPELIDWYEEACQHQENLAEAQGG